jgi:hypothetical protein
LKDILKTTFGLIIGYRFFVGIRDDQSFSENPVR